MKLLCGLVLVLACVGVGTAWGATLEWDRNAETDMKVYHVYVCKTKGCVSTNVGLEWLADVPQPIVGVKPSVILPMNVTGAASVVAENTSGLDSVPSVSLPFSTIASPKQPTGLLLK